MKETLVLIWLGVAAVVFVIGWVMIERDSLTSNTEGERGEWFWASVFWFVTIPFFIVWLIAMRRWDKQEERRNV